MTRVTEEVFLDSNHICIIGKYLLLITSEQIKFTYKAIAFRTYILFSMTNPNLSVYYIYNALFYLCKITIINMPIILAIISVTGNGHHTAFKLI